MRVGLRWPAWRMALPEASAFAGVGAAIVGFRLAGSVGRRGGGGHDRYPRPELPSEAVGRAGDGGLLDGRRRALFGKIRILELRAWFCRRRAWSLLPQRPERRRSRSMGRWRRPRH